MSFNTVPSVKPVIREAANMNNDGGGGNLGYMQQREKDEKEKKNKFALDDSIFGKKNEPDLFVAGKEIEIPDEYKFNLKNCVLKLVAFIKQIFR